MRDRRSIAVRAVPILVFCLLAMLVMSPVAHADSGSITLTVNSWEQSQSTGLVDYDVTLAGSELGGSGGICNTINGCGWEVTAWYQDGSTQIGQGYLDGGSGLLGAGTGTFSRNLTAGGFRMNEVTDIKATLSGDGQTLTQWAHVASPFAPASLDLTVNDWNQDLGSGLVTYDLEASGGGLAGVGEPCAWPTSGCGWQVTGWYKDGSTEIGQGYLSGSYGSLSQGQWSFDQHLVGAISKPEITDLELSVTNGDVTRETWVHVGDKVSGNLEMSVNKLHQDAVTGNVDFEVAVSGSALAAVGEPCASTGCYWIVYTYDSNDTITNLLGSGSLYTGTWSFSQDVVGSKHFSSPITALELVVSNGTIQRSLKLSVDADVVGGMSISAAALAVAGVSQQDLCAMLVFAPQTRFIGSQGDTTAACEGAADVRNALLAIAATGGVGVLWWLMHHHTENDALTTVDPPSSGPTTAPPTLPTVFPVGPVAQIIIERNPGITEEQASLAARNCLWYTSAIGGGPDRCTSLPIFISGRDLPQATDHDVTALLSYPAWVELNYEVGTTKPGNRQWATDLCGPIDKTVLNCDEYPFWASEQGGGSAIPTPHTRAVDKTQNQTQGRWYYNGFIRWCGVAPGGSFLGTPMPGADQVEFPGPVTFPTMGICNNGRSPWVAPGLG